jgi:hypothetical protein
LGIKTIVKYWDVRQELKALETKNLQSTLTNCQIKNIYIVQNFSTVEDEKNQSTNIRSCIEMEIGATFAAQS